jgi:hypothetical protein
MASPKDTTTETAVRAHDKRSGRSSKWITPKRRACIYARDLCACVYCDSQERLTLDHVRPRHLGGSNRSNNLVTACISCNSARGLRSVRGFVISLCDFYGLDWRVRLAAVKNAQRRRVPR